MLGAPSITIAFDHCIEFIKTENIFASLHSYHHLPNQFVYACGHPRSLRGSKYRYTTFAGSPIHEMLPMPILYTFAILILRNYLCWQNESAQRTAITWQLVFLETVEQKNVV